MAQITGEVSGLEIIRSAEPEADDEPQTAEEQLARMVITRLRQGHPKAAAAAAVDLVNVIAANHGMSCGAFL